MRAREILARTQRHVWGRIGAGVLLLVPLWITGFVVVTLFRWMAAVLHPLVRVSSDRLPDWAEFAISLAALLLLLYLAGVVTRYVIGKRMLALAEALILRIPFVKSIYGATKKIVEAISPAGRSTFQSVVLVEFPWSGMKTMAFLAGTMTDAEGHRLCKIFVPTAPNPTTGFVELCDPKYVYVTDMSLETGVKMLMSGGFLAPDGIRIRPLTEDASWAREAKVPAP